MAVVLNETPVSVPAAWDNAPHRSRTPVGAVMHHMAGYLPGTDGLFRNPSTGYATNVGIGSDGQGKYGIHVYVPEGEVAWGNGNDDLNARAISIEHENDRANGSASKPTPETHELSARYLAACAVRWGWRINGVIQLVLADFPGHDFYQRSVPGFGSQFNVTGHRSVALKDCPMQLDMAWIVARANDIISRGGVPTPVRKRAGTMATAAVFEKGRKDSTTYAFEVDVLDGPLRVIQGGQLKGMNGLGIDAVEILPGEMQQLQRERGVFIQETNGRVKPYSDAVVADHMTRYGVRDRSAYLNRDGLAVYRPN